MGVYIPNMSKPKECKKCKFCIVEAKVEGKIYPLNAYCFVQHQNIKDFTDCPLIEIDNEEMDGLIQLFEICKKTSKVKAAKVRTEIIEIDGERRADEHTDKRD